MEEMAWTRHLMISYSYWHPSTPLCRAAKLLTVSWPLKHMLRKGVHLSLMRSSIPMLNRAMSWQSLLTCIVTPPKCLVVHAAFHYNPATFLPFPSIPFPYRSDLVSNTDTSQSQIINFSKIMSVRWIYEVKRTVVFSSFWPYGDSQRHHGKCRTVMTDIITNTAVVVVVVNPVCQI